MDLAAGEGIKESEDIGFMNVLPHQHRCNGEIKCT